MTSAMRALAAQRQEVLTQLQELLVENLHLPMEPETLDPDAVLFGAGLGLDSVDAVEIIILVETHFYLQFLEAPGERAQEGEAPAQGAGEGLTVAQRAKQTMRLHMRTLNTLVDLIMQTRAAAEPKAGASLAVGH